MPNSKEERETLISFEGTSGMAEVYSEMPHIWKKLERLGFELKGENTERHTPTKTFLVPVDRLFSARGSKAKRDTSNRPVRTHEQKVIKLFQLRQGRIEKIQDKKLNRKEQRELMDVVEAIVTAKEQEANTEE